MWSVHQMKKKKAHKKQQPKETIPEEAQMLDFPEKDFNSAVINMLTEHRTRHTKCILIYFLSAKSTTLTSKALAFQDFFLFSEKLIGFFSDSKIGQQLT